MGQPAARTPAGPRTWRLALALDDAGTTQQRADALPGVAAAAAPTARHDAASLAAVSATDAGAAPADTTESERLRASSPGAANPAAAALAQCDPGGAPTDAA